MLHKIKTDMIRHLFTLFFVLCTGLSFINAQGHFPTSSIGYAPPTGSHNQAYTIAPNGRQSSLNLDNATSDIPANAEADIYTTFLFDTSGKNVYIQYTTDNSIPTKANGNTISASFSHYNDPDRWWLGSIPSIGLVGVNVRYVIYISDSDLSSGFARVSDLGYQTSWTEGDTNGFGYITQAVLPVELSSFSATTEKDKVILNWQTAQEINNDYFQIERKTANNQSWQVIGKESGAGNSDTNIRYDFTDEKPASGINFYRLKQIDFDGQFEYSAMVSVEMRDIVSIDIFPNPTAAELTIVTPADFTNGKIHLYDATGKILISRYVNERNYLNLSNLNTGIYFFRLLDKNGNVVAEDKVRKL